LGRELPGYVEPARITLGKDRLVSYFDPGASTITVVHMAGVVGEKNVAQNLVYSELVNVKETLNLAKEVIEVFKGRFVHISSSHVYGPCDTDISEDSGFNPQSKYAEQKVRAEQALIEYFGPNNQQLVILRVFSVLGWNVADFTLGGLVKRIKEGSNETIACADDVRDFMTPASISTAICKVAETQSVHGIYNLSSGIGISVRDAVTSMYEAVNFSTEKQIFVPGNSFSPRIVGDNSKILNTKLNLNLTWNPFNEFK
jgi:nucleoside-diphosphate-sugar epimerase